MYAGRFEGRGVLIDPKRKRCVVAGYGPSLLARFAQGAVFPPVSRVFSIPKLPIQRTEIRAGARDFLGEAIRCIGPRLAFHKNPSNLCCKRLIPCAPELRLGAFENRQFLEMLELEQ